MIAWTVLKSVWRRIRGPSRATMKRRYNGGLLKACITCGENFDGSWTGECPECEQKAIQRFISKPDSATMKRIRRNQSQDYEPEQAYGTDHDIREHVRYGGTMEDY